MLRNLTVGIFVLLLIAGCSGKNQFRIDGNLNGHSGEYMKIKRVDVNIPVLIDSVKIRNNGSFRMKVKTSGPEFYELGLSDADFITVLTEPGEKISLTFGGKFLFDDYKITGSPGTSKVKMLDSALNVTRQKRDTLISRYKKAVNEPDFKQIEDQLNKEYVQLAKDQRMFNIAFILKNLRSFASIKAIYQRLDENTYVLYDSRDLQYLKLVSDTLTAHYPASKQVKALKINFDQEYNRSILSKYTQLTNSLPEVKLDPSLKDLNGKRITLSSLHGKYVLLAFWSGSSGDCVSENLEFKELYKKYKNSGFEIYQINVDINEDVWRKAVKFDELPWISVREDDPTNPRNAISYNVKVLPANYLYDKEGKIIGVNLHGRNLQLRLSQLFDK